MYVYRGRKFFPFNFFFNKTRLSQLVFAYFHNRVNLEELEERFGEEVSFVVLSKEMKMIFSLAKEPKLFCAMKDFRKLKASTTMDTSNLTECAEKISRALDNVWKIVDQQQSSRSAMEKGEKKEKAEPEAGLSSTAEPETSSTPELEAGPSSTTELHAGLSSTTKLQANPSSTTELQAGPSSTAKLQAGPSLTTELQAGPSSTAKLQAGPSSTTELQAGPSSTAKLQAGPSSTTEPQAGPSQRIEPKKRMRAVDFFFPCTDSQAGEEVINKIGKSEPEVIDLVSSSEEERSIKRERELSDDDVSCKKKKLKNVPLRALEALEEIEAGHFSPSLSSLSPSSSSFVCFSPSLSCSAEYDGDDDDIFEKKIAKKNKKMALSDYFADDSNSSKDDSNNKESDNNDNNDSDNDNSSNGDDDNDNNNNSDNNNDNNNF